MYKKENIFKGFEREELRYVPFRIPRNEVVRANYFGGKVEAVSTMKAIFENFLRVTLEYGDMNTDESICTLMQFRYSYFIPLVSKHEAKDFTQLQKLQNPIYLHLFNHRNFVIDRNGSYRAREFVAKDGFNQVQRPNGEEMVK